MRGNKFMNSGFQLCYIGTNLINKPALWQVYFPDNTSRLLTIVIFVPNILLVFCIHEWANNNLYNHHCFNSRLWSHRIDDIFQKKCTQIAA